MDKNKLKLRQTSAGKTFLFTPAWFTPRGLLLKTKSCSTPLDFSWIVNVITWFSFRSSSVSLFLRKLHHEGVVLAHVVIPDPSNFCHALCPIILVPSSESVTAVEAGSDCLVKDFKRNLKRKE